MSFYMVLNSDRSLEYFPNNKAYHFQVYLKFPLVLSGSWKVALSEVKINEKVSNFEFHKDIYVFSSICEETIVDGEKQSLLRRIFERDGSYTSIFPTLFYVSVKENQIDHFDIYLKDVDGNFATFIKDPTSFTLHFRKHPCLV